MRSAAMLHFVYRSTGKENLKPRPAFYSKMVALQSFLRAVEALSTEEKREIIFLNDAPIAPPIHAVMTLVGEVIDVSGLNGRASYFAATDIPRDRGWAKDDLVYFAEDDYLYRTAAFVSLVAAARQMERPSYFSLYASAGGREPSGSPVPPDRRMVERPGKTIMAAGHEWKPALSTTSSFAVDVGALRRDLWLHRMATYSGGGWDHVISLAHKGHCPFRLKDVLQAFADPGVGWMKATGRAGARVMTDLGALASKPRWHPLMAPSPCLATHMELPHLAAGADWTSVARDAEQWATRRGLPRSGVGGR